MAKLLESAYRRYNKRYFGGRLPAVSVRWSEKIQPAHRERARKAYGWFTATDEGGEILISSTLKPFFELWRMTLLHEMCHVALREHPEEIAATSEKHSKPWFREMRRVAAAGAFDDLW